MRKHGSGQSSPGLTESDENSSGGLWPGLRGEGAGRAPLGGGAGGGREVEGGEGASIAAWAAGMHWAEASAPTRTRSSSSLAGHGKDVLVCGATD
jgi:hypothetical protein